MMFFTNHNPIVISYGRMNPPSRGHSLVVNKIQELATNLKADSSIILSRSRDKTKNPLLPEQKLRYAKNFFPTANIEIAQLEQDGIIQQAERFNEKYNQLHVVVGEDRVKQFQHLLNKYNGKNYHYESITVHSAGKRDNTNDGISGISGTKLRSFVKTNDFPSFYKCLPENVATDLARSLFDDVYKGMQLDEELNREFSKACLNELFAKGYPVTPDDEEPKDNPDPVKDKDVDWSKIKKITPKKARKFSSYRAPIVGGGLGKNMGTGIGPTWSDRAGQGAAGIGESIDAVSPAFGYMGSSNQEPLRRFGDKVLDNVTGFTLKKSKSKNLAQLRKTLPYG